MCLHRSLGTAKRSLRAVFGIMYLKFRHRNPKIRLEMANFTIVSCINVHICGHMNDFNTEHLILYRSLRSIFLNKI